MPIYETCFVIREHLKTPKGFKKPPPAVFCSNCGFKSCPLYITKYCVFKLCGIKVFKYKKEGPYVACKGCLTMLGTNGVYHCRNCKTTVHPNIDYCIGCGKGIS
ncbi:hypothetical protein VCUG_01902 [Vavraia culicis subsp. floridensis]|uniref:Zinc-ribbon 15 domain-containing protein n=1 Tax=Vavraia culicis (isolate floridensis) TaxID=948595 RepID=L2GTI1_VAVCU|nr:uncharacterized protein VCUG_01902 [Vavraia culicis subsp. floridensis]ELA46618.1 hypothetical protein VCUG_01902 [Vavraia culicis subsp. floridensis]